MKYLIGLALAAATIAWTATASSAPFKPAMPEVQSAATTQVVCQGNRRNYRNFNHCMRYISNGARYCARICSG